jgi:septal ring-binding cell division protein DamX
MNERANDSRRPPKRKFRFEMTPLSLCLGGLVLVFLMAWIFALGILAGRGFVPSAAISDLKGQIERLQGMISSGKTSGRPSDTGAAKEPEPDPKLAFYEKLSGKKEEAKRKAPGEENEGEKKGEIVAKKIEPAKKSPLEAEKKGVEVPEIPREAGKAGPGSGQFTVQLASLVDKGKAEQMARGLTGRGYDAYLGVAEVKGQSYYRVRCGRFKTREEAAGYAKRIEKETGTKAIVSRVE